MKKITLILLALIVAGSLVFVACGGKDTAVEAPKAEAAPAAPAVDVVEEAAMAYFADFPGSRIIKEDEFIGKVKAGEDMFILDIRRPDDYAASHVKGAVNIPWGPELAARMNTIPQDGQVYLYCYTGQTAGQATAVLNVAGIPVQSVRYGFVRGISTVEGSDAVISTESATATGSYSIDPAIQAAADAYFGDLGVAPFSNNIVSAADAFAIKVAGEDVQFVDIRQAEDYAKGHIEGAVNIPWAKGMQAGFADLPSDKKLLVNCYSGQTAGQAVGILNLLGYDAVSINSGMGTAMTGDKGYANEGFDLVM